MKEYDNYSQEELVLLYQKNPNDQELFDYIGKKFYYLLTRGIKRYIDTYKLDEEDFIQDSFKGLYYALKTYDFEKNDNFEAFATRCIDWARKNIVKHNLSKTSQLMTNAVSLNDDESAYANQIENTMQTQSAEKIVVSGLYSGILYDKIYNRLTKNQKKVFPYHVSHYTYKEIAEILDLNPRSVDNAIQEIKKNVRKMLKEENE